MNEIVSIWSAHNNCHKTELFKGPRSGFVIFNYSYSTIINYTTSVGTAHPCTTFINTYLQDEYITGEYDGKYE